MLFSKKNKKEETETETNDFNQPENSTTFDDMGLDFGNTVIENQNQQYRPEQNETNQVEVETTNINSDDTQTDDNTKSKNLILYIICDRENPTMLEYFREYGVNVSRIFTNISKAKDALLMQVNPIKVVLIDTGTGRFSAIGARKEIVDLMGICDDDARISIYYTDSVIKSEIEYINGIEDKKIHWHKFKSTPDVMHHLLRNKNKENYIYDANDKEKIKETPNDILSTTKDVLTSGLDESDHLGAPAININDIMIHMVNNESRENELTSYDVTI